MALIPSQIQNVFAYIHNFLDLSDCPIYQQLIKSQLPVKRIPVSWDLFSLFEFNYSLKYIIYKKENLKTIKCRKNISENPILSFVVKTRS